MSFLLLLLLVGGIDTLVHAKNKYSTEQCLKRLTTTIEYQTTNSIRHDAEAENMLQVHLIPHSHDDPGWIKTVDQYFVGSKTKISNAGVGYILDNVVSELQKDKHRQFMFVEQAFFQRWWNEKNKHEKKIARQLIQETHQLDLSVNGGWCMHDEAAPHFTAMVDQSSFGHQFLMQEFNITPQIGWQIDPFGHSATQASLLSAAMNFKGLYFARIDYQDYRIRLNASNLEFWWKPSVSRPDLSIFTGVIQDHYGAPSGFNFNYADTEPIVDDPDMIYDFNVCDRVDSFVEMCQERASHQRGNHIFLPMGGDFTYGGDASIWFSNMDKLIHYANQDSRIHVLYSNLSYYTDQKLNMSKSTWTTKTDDFFPYADSAHSYWTGYFTSRPTLKRYGRVANGFLQSARTLDALLFSSNKLHEMTSTPMNFIRSSPFYLLEAAVGVLQHHDAISGTETKAVASDYAQRIARGMKATEDHVRDLLQIPKLDFCWLRNISHCESIPSYAPSSFHVTVFNPLPKRRLEVIRIPVHSPQVQMSNQSALPFPISISPSLSPFTDHHGNVNSSPAYTIHPWMLSIPIELEPFELKTFKIDQMKADTLLSATSTKTDDDENQTIIDKGPLTLENANIRMTICPRRGSILSIWDKISNARLTNTSSSFEYYRSYQPKPTGTRLEDHEDRQCSGAYVFRPSADAQNPLPVQTGDVEIVYAQTVADVGLGQSQEIQIRVSTWAQVTFRLAPTDVFVSLEWTLGPIPVLDDRQGKEIIFKFSALESELWTNGTWYTDSNGLEFQCRRRNARPSWPLTEFLEPVAGNYYPISTGVMLRREQQSSFNHHHSSSTKNNHHHHMVQNQLTLLTDRAQGAASLRDAQVEVMLHRRLLFDDARGVNQALNDSHVARGTIRILLGDARETTTARAVRDIQDQVFQPFLSMVHSQHQLSRSATTLTMTRLLGSLPPNLRLQTLMSSVNVSAAEEPTTPRPGGSSLDKHHHHQWLVRIGHMFATGEGGCSNPVTLDLNTFFLLSTDPRVTKLRITETNLSGTVTRREIVPDEKLIHFKPTEIRTFRVEFTFQNTTTIAGTSSMIHQPLESMAWTAIE